MTNRFCALVLFDCACDMGSGGYQIFCRPVLLQKSYFPAGSVTKSHIFQQMN